MDRRIFLGAGAVAAVGLAVRTRTRASAATTKGDRLPDGAAGSAGLPAGLSLRLSAKGFAGVAQGARVPAWADAVGGLEFGQPAAAKQPTVDANAFGPGRPGVRFADGRFLTAARTGPAARLAALIDSQKHTVYLVCTQAGGKDLGCVFGASAGGESFFWCAGEAQIGRYGNRTHTVPFTDPGFVSFGGSSTTDRSGGSGNGLERIYARGGCIASSTSPMPNTNGQDFGIGATATGALPANVTIGEILVFDRPLSPLEMLQLEKWVCQHYARPLPWQGSEYLIFLGDSQTSGVGASDVVGTFPYALAMTQRKLALGQWSNLGIGGISWNDAGLTQMEGAQMQARLPKELFGTAAFLGLAPKYIVGEYANSSNEPVSELTGHARTYLKALKAESPASRIAFWTSLDRAVPNPPSQKGYNDYWDVPKHREGLIDAYVPIHSDLKIGVEGACPPHDPYGPYFSDGLHLTGDRAGNRGTGGYPYFAEVTQRYLKDAGF